jgi:hypothetical protein
VLTVTSTFPAPADGTTAVSFVLDTNVTEVAALEPTFTVAPETKCVPVIVFPPTTDPEPGLTLVTVGATK